MKKPATLQPAVPPPDDPGKRFADWEKLGEADSVLAARKRLEALQSLKQTPPTPGEQPEEHKDEQEKAIAETESRDQIKEGQSEP